MIVSETSAASLAKAAESLAGATSEYVNGRYNNVANRAYYAAFQAAIAALDLAGINPPGNKDFWGHAFVNGQFTGLLINRRKRYPASVRDSLSVLLRVREQADYRQSPVTATQADRMLRRARNFVTIVTAREQEGDGA